MLPSFQREERKGGRQGSARAAAAAALYRAAPPEARATPTSASIRRLLPGAPLPRAALPFSLFLSRSGAGIRLPTVTDRRRGLPARGQALPPPVPASGQVRKGGKPCAQPRQGDPGDLRDRSDGQRGQAAQWRIRRDSFPGRTLQPLRGRREATSNNIRDRRGRDYFLRLGPAAACAALCAAAADEPGEAPGPRRPPPGPGPRWAAGRRLAEPAEPQVHARRFT